MARDVNWKLAELPGSRITGVKSSWRPVTSIVSQRSILVLILFNIFVNDLDDGTKYTTSKSAKGKKPGGMVDRQYGCAAIQRDLQRLEKWKTGNLMEFNKGKWKVLQLGGKLHTPVYAVGPKTGEQFCKKRSWASWRTSWPWGNDVSLQQRWPVARRPTAALGGVLPADQGWWVFPSTQPWWDSSGFMGPVWGSPVQER